VKPKRKKLLIIFLTIITFYLIIVVFPKPQSVTGINPLVIQEGSMPVLIAHGGGNREFPDNTLEAFYNAFSVDRNVMMETDVSITKDGVVILSHDTTLDRKTNLTNTNIIDVNYSDLIANEVNFGYANNVSSGYNTSGDFIEYTNYLGNTVTPLDVSYPEGVSPRNNTVFLATTLEELITSFPNNLINVEIKQSGETGLLALSKVMELMTSLDDEYHTFSRIVIASFHKEIYQEMIRIQKEDHPNLLYSPEAQGVTKFFILHILMLDTFYFDKVSVLQVPTDEYGLNLSTKAFIKTAHDHNVAVHYWTIDDPDVMRLLIKNGADGIMTNIPSLLKTVLDEYK
jgi:glycerophosphoryl diester phosphodiesterase